LSTDNAHVEVVGRAIGHDRAKGLDHASMTPIFMAFDVVAILALSILVNFVSSSSADASFDITGPIGLGLLAAVVYVLATYARGLYKPWRMTRTVEQVTAAAVTWVFVVLFVGSVIFCLKIGDDTSRLAAGAFAALGLVTLPFLRWRMAHAMLSGLATGSIKGRPAIVVGAETELSRVAPGILLECLGVDERRRFTLPANSTAAGDAEVLANAVQFARQQQVAEVVLAMPWNDLERLDTVRARLRALPLPVKLLPDEAVNELLDSPRVDFGPSVAIEVQRAPLSRFELAQKRVLDIAVSGVAVITLLPLFAIIATAIKLDSKGPVIFRQRRNGFGGRVFTIFKFRSMSVMEDGAVVTQAQKNDKRVTRVGKFLRATSLDELPQVLNVLFGDMSIVGPRPHAMAHDDAYSKLISGYAFRHHVKPGITGWAQASGFRGETAELELMERRIELDLWYINNWSIWLDIKIILKTFVEVLRKQAY